MKGLVTGFLFAVWTLLCGLAIGNLADEAPIVRGVLMAAAIAALIVILWRSGWHLLPGGALLFGILGAMAVSAAYHSPGFPLAAWLLYGLAWLTQGLIKRDWRDELAVAGMVCAYLVVHSVWNGGFPLNRNTLGHYVVTFAPAMIARWGWPGVVAAGTGLLIGSRGVLLGLIVASVVLFDAPRRLAKLAAPAVAAGVVGLGVIGGVAGLWAWRPSTVWVRLTLAQHALERWWAASPAFGAGFEPMAVELRGGFFSHAHNTLSALSMQIGLVGLAIIGLAVVLLARVRPRWARWQWAMLASVGTLCIFEDLATGWPVGVALCLVLGEDIGDQVLESL